MAPHGDLGYDSARVEARRDKSNFALCQNCVTYPFKPAVNTVIYEGMSTCIGVE